MYTNRKKIRGWKNQIKKIEKWKRQNLDLDIENLKMYNRDCVKIWIDPWSRLIKRNPPQWYCKLIFKAMIEIYISWYEKLQELNEPFYLKIWLYKPNFIKSQIVVAIREDLNFYDDIFAKNSSTKQFPYQDFHRESLDLSNFNWTLFKDEYVCFEKLDELSKSEIKKLNSKAYEIEKVQIDDGEDVCYKTKIGDIWVGEIKKWD